MQSSNQGYMTFSTGIQYGQEEDMCPTPSHRAIRVDMADREHVSSGECHSRANVHKFSSSLHAIIRRIACISLHRHDKYYNFDPSALPSSIRARVPIDPRVCAGAT